MLFILVFVIVILGLQLLATLGIADILVLICFHTGISTVLVPLAMGAPSMSYSCSQHPSRVTSGASMTAGARLWHIRKMEIEDGTASGMGPIAR